VARALTAARRFIRECSGAVAAETALVSGLLTVLIAQVLDFGWFTYCSVQVKMAAQAAAAEAAVVCSDDTKLPATQNCQPTIDDLKDKMEAAANEVSIGGMITIPDDPEEGYYCTDQATEELVEVGDLNNKPADCSAYGSADVPGDFVRVTVNYTFTPLFPGLSAISYSGNTMTAEGWMRVG
jgi:Flp pilus assembly protein TadG